VVISTEINLSSFFLDYLAGNSNSWVEGIIIGVLVRRNSAESLFEESAIISLVEVVNIEVSIIFPI
jgi:hypothetical protein